MITAHILIFGFIALFSRTHRKTALIVFMAVLALLLAFEWLGTINPETALMLVACVDMIFAMACLKWGDKRAESMCMLLVFASFFHCFAGLSVILADYKYYDFYENGILTIDLIQIAIMWGSTNVRDIKRKLDSFRNYRIFANRRSRRGHTNLSGMETMGKKEGS